MFFYFLTISFSAHFVSVFRSFFLSSPASSSSQPDKFLKKQTQPSPLSLPALIIISDSRLIHVSWSSWDEIVTPADWLKRVPSTSFPSPVMIVCRLESLFAPSHLIIILAASPFFTLVQSEQMSRTLRKWPSPFPSHLMLYFYLRVFSTHTLTDRILYKLDISTIRHHPHTQMDDWLEMRELRAILPGSKRPEWKE